MVPGTQYSREHFGDGGKFGEPEVIVGAVVPPPLYSRKNNTQNVLKELRSQCSERRLSEEERWRLVADKLDEVPRQGCPLARANGGCPAPGFILRFSK